MNSDNAARGSGGSSSDNEKLPKKSISVLSTGKKRYDKNTGEKLDNITLTEPIVSKLVVTKPSVTKEAVSNVGSVITNAKPPATKPSPEELGITVSKLNEKDGMFTKKVVVNADTVTKPVDNVAVGAN